MTYPDPAIEVIDPRFAKYHVANAAVERLYTGARWTEGPVWFGDGRYLLFSDIPNDRMLRWLEETGEVSLFRHPSQYSNGNTRDRQGRLITCEHGARRVTRTEYDGQITVLVDQFEGKRLNSPNDVAVHPDGGIWFSDPGYGILTNYEGYQAEPELPTHVYRLEPSSGKLQMVADELGRPNGLCFSPDYTKLYVTDTCMPDDEGYSGQIRVYDVLGATRLANGRMFADMVPGIADGIRCDVDGNIWSSAGWGNAEDHGVHIFASDSTLLGKIHLPEVCSNVCFGGVKRNRLFMTASQSVYSVYVNTQGHCLSSESAGEQDD